MTRIDEPLSSVSDGTGLLPGEQPWALDVDGVSLSGFVRRGVTPPAGVFIHGFRSNCGGAKARHLSKTAAGLDSAWLRYDQRGCGASAGDFRHFTISKAIDDANRVLDALGHRSYVLVGSSLGGLIALHVARSGKHRIHGLALIAPALRFTTHFIHGQLTADDLETWRRRGYRWFPDLYAGGCFRLDYEFCADALRYSEPPDTLPCPVRAVHGSRDELLPWRDTREWIHGLECPARALEIIDGGDHRLTGWSQVITRELERLVNEVRQSCA